MTTNEILTKQNFLTKILLKSGDNELSKGLKVKVMGMRIEYAKVRKQFDEDVQEFIKGVSTERLGELQQIKEEDRTDEQKKELQDLINKVNSEYQEYVIEKGKEETSIEDKKFTMDEYNELVEVNADNDVEINGQKINAADFLEILYTLFVEED
jgi:hypothetical protein